MNSTIRHHPLAFGIAGVLVGTIIVSGLTAWGVASTVESGNTMAVAASALPTASAAPKVARAGKAGGGIRGTVSTIDGSIWTVKTRSGATVTVTLTGSTIFGTQQSPSSATEFSAGSPVVVQGTRTGDSLIATRVVTPKDGAGVTPTPSSSPNR